MTSKIILAPKDLIAFDAPKGTNVEGRLRGIVVEFR